MSLDCLDGNHDACSGGSCVCACHVYTTQQLVDMLGPAVGDTFSLIAYSAGVAVFRQVSLTPYDVVLQVQTLTDSAQLDAIQIIKDGRR